MSRIVIDPKLVGTKNGVELWLMHLECDTMQDVPAATVFGSNIRIAIGSTAHVIEDNSDLQINSSGVWIQQRAGSSTYTRAEIDALLQLSSTAMMRQGIEIPENANLDDYLDAGAYYSPNSARTASLYNRPWSGSGFKLLVFSISTTSKCQLYIPMSQTAHSIFQRNRITSGWQSYYEHEGVLVPTINPLP